MNSTTPQRVLRRFDRPAALRRCYILDLPDEILIRIFRNVSHPRYLQHVAHVCHHFNVLVDEILYQSVTLRNPTGHDAYIEAVKFRPQRLRDLRTLYFEFLYTKFDRYKYEEGDMLQRYSYVGKMPNLQHLEVILPQGLCTYIQDLFKHAGTPGSGLFLNLTYCYLDFWTSMSNYTSCNMDRLWVFTVPSIKCLTIRNAHFTAGSGLHLESHQKSTSLEQLTFLGCHLNDQVLKRIASVPRALRKFILNQRVSTSEDSAMHMCASPCFEAMIPARSTLETIVCDTNILDEPEYPPHDLATMLAPFSKLKYLGLDEPWFRLPFPLEDKIFTNLLPKLEVLHLLKIEDFECESFESVTAMAKHKSRLFPNLRKIIINSQHDHYLSYERPYDEEFHCLKAGIELKEMAIMEREEWWKDWDESDEGEDYSFSSSDGYAEMLMRQAQQVTFQWRVEPGGETLVCKPVVPKGMKLAVEKKDDVLRFTHDIMLPNLGTDQLDYRF